MDTPEASGGSPVARIQRLDEAVVNRIAAGEVIQRPANALKEMIENSLDAGSRTINVVVKSGGMKMMQIQDDGKGIAREDMGIVCERFTTSKLQQFEDLTSISTYGFRGEALASISHVSHVTITTKTADSNCAYKARYRDSLLVPMKPNGSADPKPCAGNKGTTILVEDLFYNVTTRRKVLNSPSEEFHRVYDVVSRYAIHNAGIAFSLKKHGESTTAVNTSAKSSTVDNIRTVFGAKVAGELLEIGCKDDRLKLKMTGWATNANYSVTKGVFMLFINHRLVESSTIKRALDEVYSAYLPKGQHSLVYMSLEIHPASVDVNVHPTKKEVHFLHEEEIVERLQKALSDKLLGANSSRTYLTQSLLPGVSTANEKGDSHSARPNSNSEKPRQTSRTRSSQSDSSRVYDYQLVRTDSKSQTLDAFVAKRALSASSCGSVDDSQSSDVWDVDRARRASSSTSNSTGSGKGKAKLTHIVEESKSDDELDWDPIRQRPRKKQRKETDQSNRPGDRPNILPVEESAPAESADSLETTKEQGVRTSRDRGSANLKWREPIASGMVGIDDRDNTRVATCWPESAGGNPPLTSIAEIRQEISASQSKQLREVFNKHAFVGCVDQARALMQYETKLMIVHVQTICREFFKQLAIRGFGAFSAISLSPPASVNAMIQLALSSPKSGHSADDGEIADLAQEYTDLLVSRGEMLNEYFAVNISVSGELTTIPALLEDYTPNFGGLPFFLLRLATHVDWTAEKECFEGVASEIGEFYKDFTNLKSDSDKAAPRHDSESEPASADNNTKGVVETQDDDWKIVVEHRIFPGLRGMFQPPNHLVKNSSIIEIADLHQLYKIFERC